MGFPQTRSGDFINNNAAVQRGEDNGDREQTLRGYLHHKVLLTPRAEILNFAQSPAGNSGIKKSASLKSDILTMGVLVSMLSLAAPIEELKAARDEACGAN